MGLKIPMIVSPLPLVPSLETGQVKHYSTLFPKAGPVKFVSVLFPKREQPGEGKLYGPLWPSGDLEVLSGRKMDRSPRAEV